MAEEVWRAGLLLILALAAVVMNKVYVFQTHPAFDDLRYGVLSDFLLYSLPFAAVFTVLRNRPSWLTSWSTTYSTPSLRTTTSTLTSSQTQWPARRSATP